MRQRISLLLSLSLSLSLFRWRLKSYKIGMEKWPNAIHPSHPSIAKDGWSNSMYNRMTHWTGPFEVIYQVELSDISVNTLVPVELAAKVSSIRQIFLDPQP